MGSLFFSHEAKDRSEQGKRWIRSRQKMIRSRRKVDSIHGKAGLNQGKSTVKQLPSPTLDSTAILSDNFLAIVSTRKSPRPEDLSVARPLKPE